MAKQRKIVGLMVAVTVAWALAGCASTSTGTAKKLTAADASLLPGVWQGRVNPPGTTGMVPATLTIRPDGTYTADAGAFSSSGKAEIKDGFVQFMSTSGTGSLGAGERSGTAVLMDRETTWGLAGSGHASVAGPYSFDFSKTK
jgi:heat shock protein HslJ